MKNKNIHFIKVISRNFLHDIYSDVQNLFGGNLTKYEQMIEKSIKEIWKEVGDRKLKWYRIEITQLTQGAIAILFYGEEDE